MTTTFTLPNFKSILLCSFASALLSYSLTACSDPVQQREAEHYILPANYVGAFYVIFDQASGEPLQYQHDARQYQIPANGVLLTQAKISEGAIAADKLRFFRQNAPEQLTEITSRWLTSIDTEQAYQDNTTYIFGGGPGVYSSSELKCDIHFRGFHIGTKSQILDEVNHFDIESFIRQNKLNCD
ncbi:DUF6843 domain-containing protein [Rheinheimera sp. EpRS3]|uniref:DUF6843 domain-containing protein n=1 Tax=Rheinheimera sp. EpRS3 TaxID=1712383 RepID=UPI000748BE9C|nr:hypothetical protein [Rheinheimera sp. EpRS3]KUM53295.1 hypothetical protein AR688_05080 [Rheinheimera sp. EpRS3]